MGGGGLEDVVAAEEKVDSRDKIKDNIGTHIYRYYNIIIIRDRVYITLYKKKKCMS